MTIGPSGIALLALGMAILVPIINVGNIIILAMFGSARTSSTSVARTIVQNPLVIGCLIGLIINMTGVEIPAQVMKSLDLISRAALGMGLLDVGAGIALIRLSGASWKVWLGVILRLVFCPLVFAAIAMVFGLGPIETLAGTLIFAVPAAANGYVIAQQMGGDADLYADILTWQTVLSLGLLPVWAVVTL